MDMREKLLHAAARVYARTGFRGATTRLIAQEAGVNEITLFRHFGSKDALLQQALAHIGLGVGLVKLPIRPEQPEQELRSWAFGHFTHFHEQRSLVRRVLGEVDERPQILASINEKPDGSACELCEYLQRLREHGLIDADADLEAASCMLTGAIFTEAITRDVLPDMYKQSADETIGRYVHLFLRALGHRAKPARPPAKRANRANRVRSGVRS
jgi:AcrR family transcriptional regulator